MSIAIRILLIIGSLISFCLCILKIKQSKLEIENTILWMIGCFLLVLMSIFPQIIIYLSQKIGFQSPANFVFLLIIVFLLFELFSHNIRIAILNQKVKDLDHYIALKEKDEIDKKGK